MDKIEEVLTRGVGTVLPSKEGLSKLMSLRRIRLYQGFDPSMPSLHLGNYVGLLKLRQFQKLGHEVIFLVGDFTGIIGDPTDKLATRKKLTRREILENAKNWKKQASMLLDFEGENPAKMLFNSEWLDKVSYRDLIEIASNFTYAQMIERDMYQKRIKENKNIFFHELLYPFAQAYDSVFMDVDLEIGGSDQLFNMLAGRTLMKAMKNKEKFVLTTKLLVDKSGNKVGKTTGNALFLDSKPNDFFAGIMSFPDEVILLGFELLTEVSLDGLSQQISKDPMSEKKRLAREVVKILWGEAVASEAKYAFENTFQKGATPGDIKTVKIKDNSLALLDLIFATKAVASRSEAKRLISQSAVEIAGKVYADPTEQIDLTPAGLTIRIGKKKFVRVVPK